MNSYEQIETDAYGSLPIGVKTEMENTIHIGIEFNR